MQRLQQIIGTALSVLEGACDVLPGTYTATIVLHTPDGDPADAVVASTGDKANALPGLRAAIDGHKNMDQIA